MRIPQHFIEDLTQRVDLAAVIGRHLELRPKGREMVGICPFHEDSKPSLYVNSDKGVYLCRACQARGNALGFLQEYEGLDFVGAVEALAAIAGVEVPREDDGRPSGPARSETARWFDLMQHVARDFAAVLRSDRGRAGYEYLRRRGVDDGLIERFQIGFAPPGWDFVQNRYAGRDQDLETVGLLTRNEERKRVYDRFRERVMFPIRDSRGRVVGFGGRVLDKGEPKYLNSPETPIFQKRRELYGFHEMRQKVRRPERVLLVEGYMDVVGLASVGVDNSVAVLGTAATEHHFRTLLRTAPEVVCCFDGDASGRNAAWRSAETLLPLMSGEVSARFLFLPDGEDPDSFARERGSAAFEQALASAVPLSRFLLEHLSEDLDLESLDDRARFKSRADPLVAKLPPGAFADLMRQQVRDVAGLVPRRRRRNDSQPRAPVASPQRSASMVLEAIALAGQHPEVASSFSPDDLARIGRAEQEHAGVLERVLRAQHNNPRAGAGWLLGSFSQTSDAAVVADALGLDINAEVQGPEALRSIIERLLQQRVSARDVAQEHEYDAGMARFQALLSSRRKGPGT